MRPTLWKWHRRLGLFACTALLLWGLSGACHPLMSAWQPRTPVNAPPQSALPLADLLSPATVLARNGIAHFDNLRLLNWQDRAVYQVLHDDRTQYYEARSGMRIEDADQAYALALAAHYLGRPGLRVTEMQRLESFDGEYTEVNRLLPVWRVTDAEGLRLYIHTPTSRLASTSDDRKAALSRFFVTLHTADWLPGPEWLRVGGMLMLLLPVLAAALSGLVVYGTRLVSRPSVPGPSWRRWHRRLGLLVSVALLSAAASGILHLLMLSSLAEKPVRALDQRFVTHELMALPWPLVPDFALSELGLARVDGIAHYRLSGLVGSAMQYRPDHAGHAPALQPPSAVRYRRRHDEPLVDGESRHARTLARGYSGLTDDRIIDIRQVTRFGGEYGFINKLLPVWRVAYAVPGRPRYYVDTASGRLAARVDDYAAFEGWTFAYLHKWEWLKPLGKPVQHAVTVLAALAYIVLGLLGIGLYLNSARPTLTTDDSAAG